MRPPVTHTQGRGGVRFSLGFVHEAAAVAVAVLTLQRKGVP
jgi:hypothetical protein